MSILWFDQWGCLCNQIHLVDVHHIMGMLQWTWTFVGGGDLNIILSFILYGDLLLQQHDIISNPFSSCASVGEEMMAGMGFMFQVKKKQFFRNFITITLFGAVGTLISFTVISLGALGLISRLNIGALELGDYLALGATFSAIDSTPFLYSLVFGEGVVNDTTSVVLFNAIQNFDPGNISGAKLLNFISSFLYLFGSSTILGVASGLLSAYTIKKLYFGRHSTYREVSIMMLMAYLSYMLAELLDLSGILTVFFCGVVMSHYTWHNVTESSRVTTKHAFATLSFISETFLFLYVGMDALDIEKWKIVGQTYSPVKSIALSSTILALVLVSRAAFVFPLSFLSNLTKKTPNGKISFRQQVIVWWAGLMRGVVSIALAYNKVRPRMRIHEHCNSIMVHSNI
ncbi:hypothetical protein ACJX0J_041112, partial [Zea mays]